MKARFARLWRDLGAAGDAGEVYDLLRRAYGRPRRYYHTLAHVRHCLDEARRCAHLARDPAALVFALWYHDAVCDPRAAGNEEASVCLALRAVARAKLGIAFGRRVRRCILATRHDGRFLRGDGALAADIDLAVFGATRARFDRYDAAIRREYGFVDGEAYFAGRAKVLRAFRARRSIYRTAFFRQRCEKAARRNLDRAIGRCRLRGES